MADEERKKTADEGRDSGESSSFMGRFGEGLIDGLAETKPLIGKPLQYAFGTQAYQDQQRRRQAAREQLAMQHAQYEEWKEGADLRRMQRENAETAAAEWAAGAEDRADQRSLEREKRKAAREQLAMQHAQNEEWRNNASVREDKSDAESARARLAASLADRQHLELGVSGLMDSFRKEMGQNPLFSSLSFPGQDALLASPRLRNLFEAKYYTGEVMAIGKHDPGAYRRMERRLRDNDMELVDGPDGIKYLSCAKLGMSLPATKETIDQINEKISKAALEEMNTRAAISDSATMGNPAMRSISRYTRALMPYNGNDATNSYRFVKGIMDGASEEEKGWHLFHQAIQDFRSSGLPTKAKMAGLVECMKFLPKMGYEIKEIDPKNPDVSKATIIDLKLGRPLTFDEFAKICEDNDSLGARLDGAVGNARKEAISRDRALFAQEVAATQQALRERRLETPSSGSGKGGKKKVETGETTDDAGDKEREEISREFSALFGDNYEGLPEKKRSALIDAKKEWDADKNTLFEKYDVDSVADLPDEALTMLNSSWITLMDEAGLSKDVFYSPVSNMILERENERLSEKISSEIDPRSDQQMTSLIQDGTMGFWGAVGAGRVIGQSDDKEKSLKARIAENQEIIRGRGRTPAEHNPVRKEMSVSQSGLTDGWGQQIPSIAAQENVPIIKRRDYDAAIKRWIGKGLSREEARKRARAEIKEAAGRQLEERTKKLMEEGLPQEEARKKALDELIIEKRRDDDKYAAEEEGRRKSEEGRRAAEAIQRKGVPDVFLTTPITFF